MNKRTCHILFSDYYTGVTSFQDAMKSVLNCEIITILDLFKRQSEMDTALSRRINSYVSTGKIVPTALIIDQIREELSTGSSDFVIVGYPRSIDHLEKFIELLNEMNIELSSYWYLKQLKPEYVATNFCKKASEKYSIDKNHSILLNRIIQRQNELNTITEYIGIDHVNTVLCDPEKDPHTEVELKSIVQNSK